MMEESYSAILDGADIDATLAQLEEDSNVSLCENTPEGCEPAPMATLPEAHEPQAATGPYDAVDPTGATVLWWHQHTQEREEGLQEMVDRVQRDQRVGYRGRCRVRRWL